MASYEPKIRKERYRNWLKAWLALLITKEGISDFVYDEIEQFQIKCLADICQIYGLPPNTICSCCSTVEILLCPTAGICKTKFGSCKFHDNNHYRTCPNGICDGLRKAITNAHRYRCPSYKNTDSTRWCSDTWELAKCYMPADGYSDAKTIAETDFNGVLSVILNHKSFQSKLSDDLSKRGIFFQARDIGSKIRHCSDLELDTSTLLNYITSLENLLADPKCLQHNQKAQSALKALTQLKSNTLVVRADDLEKALRDATSVMQANIVDEADKRKQDILLQVTNALSSLQLKQDNCLDAVTTAMVSTTALMQSKAEGMVKTISNLSKTEGARLIEIGNKVKAEAVQTIEKERTSAENTVQKAATEGIKDLTEFTDTKMKSFIQTAKTEVSAISESEQQKLGDTGKEIIRAVKETGKSVITAVENVNDEDESARFEKLKTALREDLIDFYRSEYSNLPLSPLFEENDAPLTEFYVTPTMYVHGPIKSTKKTIKSNHQSTDKSKAPIKSYKDLFHTGVDLNRNIYVTAPAGIGKTSFANNIALTWCQSHNNPKTNDEFFPMSDLDALEIFEFLFYVSLRDVRQSNCDVDNMITTHVIDRLPRAYLFTRDFLQKVLYKENHLVLLDGLDEWTPNPQCEFCRKTAIPHRKNRQRCTHLTTTRPWKFDLLRLNATIADQHIEIASLSGHSVPSGKSTKPLRKLADNVVSYLNDKNQTSKSVDEFFNLLHEKMLWKISEVPLTFLQLLCLWYDDEPLGVSQCQIYSNMVNLLFERYARVKKEENSTSVHVNDNSQKLPICFDPNAECSKYTKLLFKLGKLAFDRLCSIKQEQELVFERTVALKVLNENDLEICLKIGILTQSKNTDNKLTQRKSNISFLHKTYQEFLAALYISTIEDADEVQASIFQSDFTLTKILEFEMLFIFMAGLNSDIMPVLLKSLISFISKDVRTEDYRRNIDAFSSSQDSFAEDYSDSGAAIDQKRILKDIQDIVVMCSIECMAHKKEILPNIVEDVFCDDNSNEYLYTLKELVSINSKKVLSLSCDMRFNDATKWACKILQDVLTSVTSLQKFSLCHSVNIKFDNESTESEDDRDTEVFELEKVQDICCEEIIQETGNVKFDKNEEEKMKTHEFKDSDRTKDRRNIKINTLKHVDCNEIEEQKSRSVDLKDTKCHSEDTVTTGSVDNGGANNNSFNYAFELNQLLSRSIKTMISLDITSPLSSLHFSVLELQDMFEHISNMEEIGQVKLEALHCNGKYMERVLDFKVDRLKKLEILSISRLPDDMKLSGLQACCNLKMLSISYIIPIDFQIPKKGMKKIFIRAISMSHSSMKRMLKNISRASELTHIELDDVLCNDHDECCEGFHLNLISLTQPCKISLKGIRLAKLRLNGDAITHLEMTNIYMNFFNFRGLIVSISELKCIKSLNLWRVGCGQYQNRFFPLDLSNLKELQELCLMSCYIELVGFEKSRLCKFKFGESVYLEQFQRLCTAQTLREIILYKCETAITELALKIVSNLKKLQIIELQFITIPENALGFISDMHELEKIKFRCVEMSAASFGNLIRSLSQLRQSVELSFLLGCSIEPMEEFEKKWEMLQSSALFETNDWSGNAERKDASGWFCITKLNLRI